MSRSPGWLQLTLKGQRRNVPMKSQQTQSRLRRHILNALIACVLAIAGLIALSHLVQVKNGAAQTFRQSDLSIAPSNLSDVGGIYYALRSDIPSPTDSAPFPLNPRVFLPLVIKSNPLPLPTPTSTPPPGNDPILFFVSDLVSSGSLSRAQAVVGLIQTLMSQHPNTQMLVA